MATLWVTASLLTNLSVNGLPDGALKVFASNLRLLAETVTSVATAAADLLRWMPRPGWNIIRYRIESSPRKPNTPTRWTNTHHCNTRQRPPGRAVQAILAGCPGLAAGSAGRRRAGAGAAIPAVAGRGRRSPEGDGRQDLHSRQADGDHHVPLESLWLVEDGEPDEGPGKGEPHAGPRRGVERVKELVAKRLGIESDRRPLEDRANPQQAQEDSNNGCPHPHRSSLRFADRSR